MKSWSKWLVGFQSKLSGPAAFDNSVIGLFAFGSIWVTTVVDIGRTRESLSLWALAGFGSMLVAVVWLTLARAFIPSVRGRQTSFFTIMAIYGLAGTIRNLSLVYLCSLIGLTPPNGRLINSILAAIALLTFANLTAGRRRESRKLHQEQLAERQKLIWLSATYDEKVLQSQRDLSRQLDTELYPSVRLILEKLSHGETTQPKSVAQDLLNTVANVVRPMCDKLSQSTDNILGDLDSIVTGQVGEPRADTRVSITRAIRPNVTVITLLIIAATISPALGKDSDFGPFIFESLLAWAILGLTQFIWPKRNEFATPAMATLALAAIYAVAFATAALTIGLSNTPAPIILVQFSFSFGSAWIFARMAIANELRSIAEAEVIESNEQLSKLITRLRKQIWITRRNATWILHGPIQSALVSSAMALADPNVDAEERSKTQKRILDALVTLDSSDAMVPQITDALANIAAVWSRSCDVKHRISPEVLKVLQSDPGTTACLIEIAREGVSNAIRHGKASAIEIGVSRADDSLLKIEILDSGVGSGKGIDHSGLGTAMLDQVTHSWRLEDTGNGCLLTCYVISEPGS